MKGIAKKRRGKEREYLHKPPRKVKVESFDGRMEQENSSALVCNIEK